MTADNDYGLYSIFILVTISFLIFRSFASTLSSIIAVVIKDSACCKNRVYEMSACGQFPVTKRATNNVSAANITAPFTTRLIAGCCGRHYVVGA